MPSPFEPSALSEAVDVLMRRAPVIPVVVLKDARHAAPLARALAKGGAPAVEITLRTEAALEAIRRAAEEVPEAIVGAGTLLSPKDVKAAKAAGARFGVSPGLTPSLIEAASDEELPLLPGVATASEIVTGLEHGLDRFKLFPAEAVGGRALLKALAGPFPNVAFCPTGGITLETVHAYLELPNVICVGGSWLAPAQAMEAGDWAAIEKLARVAVDAALGRTAV
jgi:2-dehydro-3-deoxyphosphogluconate aldolase/(4S)-4-hydroxy-2-oxoglutarate aldolase